MRTIEVAGEKCIGCRACSTVCSPLYITLTDDGNRRTIVFPLSCEEDCDLCLKACPTGAIAFGEVPRAPLTLEFELISCARCGNPFATKEELAYVLPRISRVLGGEPAWGNFCPECRGKESASGLRGKQSLSGNP
ncbi:MAG: 4Fe-4S dicluster domain-containing protein [Anaerolineae bacterium]|nr:4Fe-4S dicluster domain-containing protein [Anaerolineae bacterium]MDW8102423.1 4Fe-4S dicluster domain-containing protein [Anaerolineae bacterium]